MKTLRLIFCAILSLLACARGAEVTRVNFTDSQHEFSWPLKELNADLPVDWSGNKFLTLELRSSTAQRIEFSIQTTNGLRKVRLHPFPDVWIRAALPLKYFARAEREGHDIASLGNKPRPGYWINPIGPYGPLHAVQSIGVAMQEPIGSPTLEIRNVRLDKESPGDAVLESQPLVDEFGQWIRADWSGKAKSLDDLKNAWAAEEKELKPVATNTCRYGGFANTKAKATGFFRVEQIDGRWWFVDPDGHLFFSVGADSMRPWNGTPVAGRESVFTALPPAGLSQGQFRARDGDVSFHTWNLVRRFGENWRGGWTDHTLRRMDAWGFNTIACWSDAQLWDAGRKPYVVFLRGWGLEGGFLGLPDVFAEDFTNQVNAAAQEQCAPRKGDPFLLGYFVGNEPPWPGRELDIADAIVNGPPSAMQRELKTFLADGDTSERRREFVHQAIGRFLNVVNAAIRKHDPSHLNLGLRYSSCPPEEILRASRGFDVFSINCYQYEVPVGSVDLANRITGRPVLIGEFHFGTPGRGLAPGLRQVVNQDERGVAYRYYVENAAEHPAIVGAHWFCWVDQPNTGRSDGENYGIGLVDVTDRPYEELVAAAKATHQRLQGIHSGKEAPVSRKANIWKTP